MSRDSVPTSFEIIGGKDAEFVGFPLENIPVHFRRVPHDHATRRDPRPRSSARSPLCHDGLLAHPLPRESLRVGRVHLEDERRVCERRPRLAHLLQARGAVAEQREAELRRAAADELEGCRVLCRRLLEARAAVESVGRFLELLRAPASTASRERGERVLSPPAPCSFTTQPRWPFLFLSTEQQTQRPHT